ncbi:MAG: PAS domain S-box protein [Promethearchaeota archaeon]
MVGNENIVDILERKYQSLFKNSIACIAFHKISYDLNGVPVNYVITDVNPMYEKILGLKKENVVGRLATDVYTTKEPPFFPIFLKVAETLIPTSFTAKFDELNRYFRLSVFSFEKGTFVTVFEDFSDHMDAIKKLKEKEEELTKLNLKLEQEVEERTKKSLESEIQFQNIVQSNPMGIHMYKLEPDNRLIFIGTNPTADKILGVDNTQFIGKTIEEAFPSLADSEVPTEYRKVAKEGTSWSTKHFTYEDQQIKGAYDVYAFQTSPGKMAALFLDVTEQKIAEMKLKESEEKYRALFEQAGDAIVIIDPETGNLIEYNNKTFEVLGYTSKEFKNIRIADYNIIESEEDVINHLKKVKKEGSDIFETKHRTKSGEIKDVLINAKLVKFQNKNAIQGIWRDITDLKIAEKKRIESEEKYRALFEQAGDAIVIIDPKNGNLIDFNNKTFEVLGYTRDEFKNMGIADFNAEGSEKMYEKFKKIVTEGSDIFETIHRTKSGELKNILVNAKIIKYQDKNVIQGIWRDITYLKQTEEKYQQAYNLAEFYKDLFAHDISNIMQNILTSIELSTIYLKKKEEQEKILSLFDLIKNQVKRGANLVSNVRKLSTLDSTIANLENIDINEYLSNSIKQVKKRFPNVKLNTQVETRMEKISIKGTQLLQDVFLNIINNAVKHNENSEIELIIKISKVSKEENDYLKLEFIDNGRGVIDSQKREIFERQINADQKSKGIGLGLSLVKRIIESIQGEIWVEDKIKGNHTKGSNFVLLLPIFP